MSTTFILKYPSGSSTYTWVPSKNPDIGSQMDDDAGIIGQVMADEATQYAYQIAEPHTVYTRSFSGLTLADRTNFLAFSAVVLGAPFDFSDGACGPITATKKVKFAPAGYRRTWKLQSGGRLGLTLVMMDSA